MIFPLGWTPPTLAELGVTVIVVKWTKHKVCYTTVVFSFGCPWIMHVVIFQRHMYVQQLLILLRRISSLLWSLIIYPTPINTVKYILISFIIFPIHDYYSCDNFDSFCRYLGGVCCSLIIVAGFVLSQELVGTDWRSFCGILLGMCFALGIGYFSALAAAVDDWRTLTLICSVSGILFLCLPW